MPTRQMNGSESHQASSEPPKKRQRQSKKPIGDPEVGSAWYDLTPKKMLAAGLSLVFTLVGAGWLSLPAKQSDMTILANEVKAGFAKMEDGFRSIGDKLRSVDERVESLHADMIRVQTIQGYSASIPGVSASPAAPAARAIRKVPRPKESIKANAPGWFN